MNNTPYFGQWESISLIDKIISQEIDASEDPLWAQSGTLTQAEYAHWSRHLCGIACIKMILV